MASPEPLRMPEICRTLVFHEKVLKGKALMTPPSRVPISFAAVPGLLGGAERVLQADSGHDAVVGAAPPVPHHDAVVVHAEDPGVSWRFTPGLFL